MPFNKDEASELLAKCHRRCCICHRFCGVKMELHHAEQSAYGGSNSIDNAIPLCLECHAEVNHYNDAHPKGRKFSISELKIHKKQWLEVCESHPEVLISASRDTDIGPLEGMLLEMAHNNSVVNMINRGTSSTESIGCNLIDAEFKRAIAQGSLLLLPMDLRKKLSEAYAHVSRINTFVSMYSNTPPEGNVGANANNKLLEAYRKSEEYQMIAFSSLNTYLLNKEDEEDGL